jgi:hypothetical protein
VTIIDFLFRPLILFEIHLNYLAFHSFEFECTWWRLLWVYLMEVIVSVPDGGYCECTWWRLLWVYLMEVIVTVPDGGYCECTWWRLLWPYLMEVIVTYLMEVIVTVPDGGYSKNASWAFSLISTFLIYEQSPPNYIMQLSKCSSIAYKLIDKI